MRFVRVLASSLYTVLIKWNKFEVLDTGKDGVSTGYDHVAMQACHLLGSMAVAMDNRH